MACVGEGRVAGRCRLTPRARELVLLQSLLSAAFQALRLIALRPRAA